MRLTLATLALLFTTLLFAQAPALIPYQAIARNAAGEPLASSTINARFTIHDVSATGASVWQELQTVSTSALGLFTAQLGSSVPLANVNWAGGAKFMQVEIDLGSGFVDIGTQQLLSVPYALHSGAASNGVPSGGEQGQVLTNCNGVPTWTNNGLCPGAITDLNCASATNQGSLMAGTAASSVSSTIAYTGGNGGVYSAQSVVSTGVTGLTATLIAGTLASGTGSVTYTITGTPSASGTASFALSLGGQSCTFTRTVNAAAPSISAINCGAATNQGTLTAGVVASGVSSAIGYTGGNGGAYSAQSVSSTGVTGLTATLTAGTLASGAGSVTYTITGTPSASGTASFALSLGGQSCTFTRTVAPPAGGGGSSATCGAANVHNPDLTYGSMTDQGGNVYKTIVIGTQEWMAENLKTSIYRNGDAIPGILDNAAWSETTSGAWAHYNYQASYACPYGKLYNWYTCADARQLCPVGWHVPTDAEWTVLTSYLGGESIAGGKMKTTGTIEAATGLWYSPNTEATNSSGFSGAPGGFRYGDGGYFGIGYGFAWWSSSELVTSVAWYRSLYYLDGYAFRDVSTKQDGFSVRCLRD